MKKTAFLRAALAALLPAAASATVLTRPAGALPKRGALAADRPWVVILPEEKDPCEYSVYDMEGRLLAGPYAISRFAVPRPVPWSAENPVCYRLSVKRGGEVEDEIFGFCTRAVRNGKLYVNGRPVRVRFAPKDQNGNAEFSSRITEEDAFLSGIYRIDGAEACEIAHEVASGSPEATFHRFRDWSVSPTNYFARIVVRNGSAFTGSDGVELRWTLLRDGEPAKRGTIDLPGIEPLSEAVFDMPSAAEEARFDGGTVSMRFEFRKGGRVVASDQIDLVESRNADPICPPRGFFGSLLHATRVKSAAEDGTRVFSASGTKLVFPDDEPFPLAFGESGFFGRTLFCGMRLANDIVDLDSQPLVAPRQPPEERRGAVSVAASSLFPYGFPGSKHVALVSRWTFYPNGIAAFRGRVSQDDMQGRCGFALTVPCPVPSRDWRKAWFGRRAFGENVEVEWFGYGPRDNTQADREGAFLGRWTKTAASSATASGTRALRIGDLTVRTLDAPFDFRLEPDAQAGTLSLVLYPAKDADSDAFPFGFAFSRGGGLSALSPDDTLDIPE